MYGTGKTLRRTPNYSPEERHLCVKSEDAARKTVKIFDNEFHCGLNYSIKKRKRWNISSILSDGLRDEDLEEQTDYQPVTYCTIQIRNNKSNYVLDSMSRKEIGTRDIPDSGLPKKPVNYRSVLKEIKQSTNQTDNEYYKSSKKKKKSKRTNSKISPPADSTCLPKDKFVDEENDVRNDGVYMNEYYNYNNEISPLAPWTYKVLNKEKKSRVKRIHEYESDSDFENDYYEDDDDPEDVYTTNKKEFQLIEYDVTQPVPAKKTKKRKSNKKDKQLLQYQDDWTSISHIMEMEDFEMIDRDSLPFIFIDEACDLLKEEIREIAQSFHCWISDSSPVSVLIDIGHEQCTMDKRYVIVKPQCVKDNTVSIKVIFNISNFDLAEISKRDFQNVKGMIEFVHSKYENKKYPRCLEKNGYYELDKPVEQLINTWEIKTLTSMKPLFCFNEAWKDCALDNNNLEAILNEEDKKYLKEEGSCDICSDALSGSEATLMKQCQHRICGACLNYHVVDLLKNDAPSLTCPVHECGTILDCASILAVTPFAHYRNRLEAFEGEFMRKQCTRCSYCGALVVFREMKPDSQTQLEYICVCNRMICGYCGLNQHWPTSCANMRIHNSQMVKLNDNDIKPTKFKLIIVTGRSCPQCNRFVPKIKPSKALRCLCKIEFCFTCGLRHDCRRKCPTDSFEPPLTYDMTKYNPFPVPDAARPRYYVESMNIHLLSHPANVSVLKKKLMKIDLKIKNCKSLNHEHAVAQYSQILSIVESIYISIYQTKRKEKPGFRNLLKLSAKNLMFYIYKLEAIINELDEQVRRKDRSVLKVDEVSRKREMFNVYLRNALDFVTKLQIFIR